MWQGLYITYRGPVTTLPSKIEKRGRASERDGELSEAGRAISLDSAGGGELTVAEVGLTLMTE